MRVQSASGDEFAARMLDAIIGMLLDCSRLLLAKTMTIDPVTIVQLAGRSSATTRTPSLDRDWLDDHPSAVASFTRRL
jgi:hypothetical protein